MVKKGYKSPRNQSSTPSEKRSFAGYVKVFCWISKAFTPFSVKTKIRKRMRLQFTGTLTDGRQLYYRLRYRLVPPRTFKYVFDLKILKLNYHLIE